MPASPSPSPIRARPRLCLCSYFVLSAVAVLLGALATSATFVDIGPRSDLTFVPRAGASAPLPSLDPPLALRGEPRGIMYDRRGNTLLFSESRAACAKGGGTVSPNASSDSGSGSGSGSDDSGSSSSNSSGGGNDAALLGIDISVYRPTQSVGHALFNQSICDDSADVQMLSRALDPRNGTVYVAYLVDESPQFINLDRLDAASGIVENIVSFNTTSGQPFALSAIVVPPGIMVAPSNTSSALGSRTNTTAGDTAAAATAAATAAPASSSAVNGQNTTRIFASGNEAVWYVQDGFVDLALLYPVGNTIVASAAVTLPRALRDPMSPDVPLDMQDVGARLYAIVRSDADGALFLHVQDAFHADLRAADADLSVARPARLYRPPPPPSVGAPSGAAASRNKTAMPNAPLHHGLEVCGAAAFVLVDGDGKRGNVSIMAFGAADLAPVGTLQWPSNELGAIVDVTCDAAQSNLLLLTAGGSRGRSAGTAQRSSSSSVTDALVTLSPTLRVLSVEPFGAVAKPVHVGSGEHSESISFRRVAISASGPQGSLLTMLQAVLETDRPDVARVASNQTTTVATAATMQDDLMLGAMMSVTCGVTATGGGVSGVMGALARVRSSSSRLVAGAGASSAASKNMAVADIGGYTCARCATSAAAAPGVLVSRVGTRGADDAAGKCVYLKPVGAAASGSEDATDADVAEADTNFESSLPCPPPYYLDEKLGACRFCTGESNGESCKILSESGAAGSTVEGVASTDAGPMLGAVGAVGAVVGALGGLLYYRKSAEQSAPLPPAKGGELDGEPDGGPDGGADDPSAFDTELGSAKLPETISGVVSRSLPPPPPLLATGFRRLRGAVPSDSAKAGPPSPPSPSSPLPARDPLNSVPLSMHTRSSTATSITSTSEAPTASSTFVRALGLEGPAPPVSRALGAVPPRAPGDPAPAAAAEWLSSLPSRAPPLPPMPLPPMPTATIPRWPTHGRSHTAGGIAGATTMEATLYHANGPAPGGRGMMTPSRSVPANLAAHTPARGEAGGAFVPPVPTLPGSRAPSFVGSSAATLAPGHGPRMFRQGSRRARRAIVSNDWTATSGILGALPAPPTPDLGRLAAQERFAREPPMMIPDSRATSLATSIGGASFIELASGPDAQMLDMFGAGDASAIVRAPNGEGLAGPSLVSLHSLVVDATLDAEHE